MTHIVTFGKVQNEYAGITEGDNMSRKKYRKNRKDKYPT